MKFPNPDRRFFADAFAALLFALLAVAMFMNRYPLEQYGDGDAASLYEAIDNIAAKGVPWCQIQANWWEFRSTQLLTLDAARFCETIETYTGARSIHPVNILVSTHTYFILYLLAPLTLLFPVEGVVVGLTALCYAGVLAAAYFFLRRGGMGFLAALAFAFLVIGHPVWTWSQQYTPYVDKWFPFFMMAFLATYDRKGPLRWIAALCCILVGERGAIYVGALLLGHAWLTLRGATLRQRFQWTGAGIGMLAFGVFLAKVVIRNPDNQGFLAFAFTQYANSAFLAKLLIFAAFNLPFLAIALIGDWRAGLIALGAMFPNIHGSIGGAEKTGWVTHYHSYYFPLLVWAAARGYLSIESRLKASPKSPLRACARLVPAGAIALALLYMAADPFSAPSSSTFSTQRLSDSILPKLWRSTVGYRSILQARREVVDAIEKAIPPGSTLTTTMMMSPLYRGRNINHLPLNLDVSDYVVLPFSMAGEIPRYSALTSYLGPVNQEAMNACLLQRMAQQGFRRIYSNRGYGVAVFERPPGPPQAP